MGMFDDWKPVTKESQLKRTRRTPKKKDRGKFSQKTIDAILERDQHRCVKCQRSNMIETIPHHVIYKSQGGEGIKRNGVCICRMCHDWAHGKRRGPQGEPTIHGRKWFETWVEKNLDQNGDLIDGVVQWDGRSRGQPKRGI